MPLKSSGWDMRELGYDYRIAKFPISRDLEIVSLRILLTGCKNTSEEQQFWGYQEEGVRPRLRANQSNILQF
jgi:hypothetical protein